MDNHETFLLSIQILNTFLLLTYLNTSYSSLHDVTAEKTFTFYIYIY